MRILEISALMLLLNFSCQFRQKEFSDLAKPNYRSAYHFTPPVNWMNDPNGMVYHEGEYHLFYQYHPDGMRWGPMHWGHAISTDMIHWEHLPIALYPDSLGQIFSGSAVMDVSNTSGFGSMEQPPMVAIYTYHDMKLERAGRDDYESQGIAFSLDKGRTWQKYSGNPVLTNPGIRDFRDPKVSWHEDSQKWIIALAAKDRIQLYSSPDLISWQYESDFGADIGAHGGVWECPDLFTLQDETGQTKWIMLVSINPGGPNGGSATQYFIGEFDGQKFTPQDSATRWVDHGTDNYAGVTWSGVPLADGRRLTLGWMNNWKYANEIPESGVRGAMTIPREFRLIGTSIQSVPVNELNSLRKESIKLDLTKSSFKLPAQSMEMELLLDGSEFTQPVDLIFSNSLNERLVIRLSNDTISVDRTASGAIDFSDEFPQIISAPFGQNIDNIRIYLDRISSEIFINEGLLVMTQLTFPTVPYNIFSIEGNTENIKAIYGHVLEPVVDEGS